jgi:hypothetical protein
MKWIAVFLLAVILASPAMAENCSKSREYILDGLAGDLAEPAANYRDLFKVCMQVLAITNVKDAYVLKDGGIAIAARRNTLAATTETLAQFCQQFPKSVARFLTPREQRNNPTVGVVVMMSSRGATSCKEISGNL